MCIQKFKLDLLILSIIKYVSVPSCFAYACISLEYVTILTQRMSGH